MFMTSGMSGKRKSYCYLLAEYQIANQFLLYSVLFCLTKSWFFFLVSFVRFHESQLDFFFVMTLHRAVWQCFICRGYDHKYPVTSKTPRCFTLLKVLDYCAGGWSCGVFSFSQTSLEMLFVFYNIYNSSYYESLGLLHTQIETGLPLWSQTATSQYLMWLDGYFTLMQFFVFVSNFLYK